MNPIWTQQMLNAVRYAIRQCPQCKKATAYPQKRVGQFHKCRHCGHRFKEKGG